MEAAMDAPQFKLDAIGEWGGEQTFEVERDKIKAYAAAANDPIEAHRNGDVAPPVFTVVPGFPAFGGASMTVIPPEMLMAVLHGEQDFHYHRPIVPGMRLGTRARVIGVHGRSSGVTVVIHVEVRDKEADELVVEQYMTAFVRGGQIPEGFGDMAPPHGFNELLRSAEPIAVVDQTFDKDQTFRYSEASGDPMPIHLDDDLAKSVGLPGIIIHGLCTMAFTSVAVIQNTCPDDPSKLKRLAVRFSKTVQPEQTITTSIWDAGEGTYAYETTSGGGGVVIKDGLAKVSN